MSSQPYGHVTGIIPLCERMEGGRHFKHSIYSCTGQVHRNTGELDLNEKLGKKMKNQAKMLNEKHLAASQTYWRTAKLSAEFIA